MPKKKEAEKKSPSWLLLSISSLMVFFYILTVFFNFNLINLNKKNKLRNNLYFASLDIGGLSKHDAKNLILKKAKNIEEVGIPIIYNNEVFKIPQTSVAFDPDLFINYFYFISDDLDYNLTKNLKHSSLLDFLSLSRKTKKIKANFNLNKEAIKLLVEENFKEQFFPASDASFVFKDTLSIGPEKLGKVINWDKFFQDLELYLSIFSSNPIELKSKTDYPEIYAKDILGLESEALRLSEDPLALIFDKNTWHLESELIASWLSAYLENDEIKLKFKKERIIKYLETEIAPEINRATKEPKFELSDNRVLNWQLGENGLELNLKESAEKIIKNYTKNQLAGNELLDEEGELDLAHMVELIVSEIKPEQAEPFEVEEVIGTGHSNFAGSSSNRVHNIRIGAEAVHGLLIRPGEEFSLVKALGDISAATGYLPELVIKGNETVLEYGGGLCQIGTTFFRTAINSGLEITARQNHSYRVSYYEPAGTDATIYDPWPDFRFLNDTEDNILIQSRIEGSDIYFDFWGKKDGRLVFISDPVIYNIVPPPPRKLIETEDLKPGEIKCTESAHSGADAYFDYTVNYPPSSERENLEASTRFRSHYVPWQEVCLIGVDPKKESLEEAEEDSGQATDHNTLD